MKRIVFLTVMALVGIFAGCNNANERKSGERSKETVRITHELGEAAVPLQSKRVVSLDYSVLETLDELGIGVIGIPKGNLPQHLEKYGHDTSVADLGTLKEINMERLNELNPDVIFIAARLQNSYGELSKIAPTVYLEVEPKAFLQSFKSNLDIIGQIFKKENEVQAAYADIETKVNGVKEKAAAKNVTGLVTLFNKGKFSAYGTGSRFGIIHDILGIRPAVANIEDAKHGQVISNEFILNANPDYLFVIDRGAAVAKKGADKSEIENALIQKTKAYKSGRIIYLHPEIWYLCGSGISSVNAMMDDINKALDK